MGNKQISISRVRQIEKCIGENSQYKITYLDSDIDLDTGIDYIDGIVDSIYHDGPHCTTFTVTFNIN